MTKKVQKRRTPVSTKSPVKPEPSGSVYTDTTTDARRAARLTAQHIKDGREAGLHDLHGFLDLFSGEAFKTYIQVLHIEMLDDKNGRISTFYPLRQAAPPPPRVTRVGPGAPPPYTPPDPDIESNGKDVRFSLNRFNALPYVTWIIPTSNPKEVPPSIKRQFRVVVTEESSTERSVEVFQQTAATGEAGLDFGFSPLKFKMTVSHQRGEKTSDRTSHRNSQAKQTMDSFTLEIEKWQQDVIGVTFNVLSNADSTFVTMPQKLSTYGWKIKHQDVPGAESAISWAEWDTTLTRHDRPAKQRANQYLKVHIENAAREIASWPS